MIIHCSEDNGKTIYAKVTEYQYGKMEPDMKVIGTMINLMEREHITSIQQTLTKDNFIMEKLMVMEHSIHRHCSHLARMSLSWFKLYKYREMRDIS